MYASMHMLTNKYPLHTQIHVRHIRAPAIAYTHMQMHTLELSYHILLSMHLCTRARAHTHTQHALRVRARAHTQYVGSHACLRMCMHIVLMGTGACIHHNRTGASSVRIFSNHWCFTTQHLQKILHTLTIENSTLQNNILNFQCCILFKWTQVMTYCWRRWQLTGHSFRK